MTSRPSAFAIAVAVAESMPPERRTTAVGLLTASDTQPPVKALRIIGLPRLVVLRRRASRRAARTDPRAGPPVDSPPSPLAVPRAARSRGLRDRADRPPGRTVDPRADRGTPHLAAGDPRRRPRGRPRRTPETLPWLLVGLRSGSGGLRAARFPRRSAGRGPLRGGGEGPRHPGKRPLPRPDSLSRGRFPRGAKRRSWDSLTTFVLRPLYDADADRFAPLLVIVK